MGRHPEILRVSHQIYFEAFPVLYSGLEMVNPSKGTWRYKTLEADTAANYYIDVVESEIFEVLYDPPLLTGTTKPQRLDKFTKVLLLAGFVIPEGPMLWSYDEEDGKLSSELQQEMTHKLCASNMVERFVELLADCSWVDHVDLDFRLVATWREDQQVHDENFDIDDFDADHLAGLRKVWHKGDIQVADIFLASGVLDPLQSLSNVKSWCIEFTMEDLYEQPPCMHESMTLDLRNGIKQKR